MTMKRRYKSNIKYPLTIARGDIARNRDFEKPSDTMKSKRVRFDDTEMDDAPVHGSSGGREAIQSPRCVAAKTSEYAYFKKVKNGSVHGHSHTLHKENGRLKSSKINDLTRETTSASDKLKHSMKDLNFSVSGERTGPSDHTRFLSPHVSKYDASDQIRSKELTNQIRKRTSSLSGNVTPVGQSLFSSQLNESSEKSENQCSVKGIFSEKRLRLRQWVSHTCSEVEKLHPNGFDLVSSLLSRLISKGNENNNDSSKGDANNNTKSPTFYESNNLENGLHLSHKRDWDKDLPKNYSGRWSDIVAAECDSVVPGSYYVEKCYLQDESIDPDQHLKSCICRSSETHHGFSFCLPFESHRSSGSFHFKDLDEFASMVEHEREPYRLLLGWDSELGKDRFNPSIVNHDVEKSMCARLPNSWNVDRQRLVDNVLDDNTWPSSLFANYYLESNAYPNYRFNGGLMHRFGPNFDEVNCTVAKPEQFSLALPCPPTCTTLAEDRFGENMPFNSNIMSYRDQDWLKKKVLDGNPPLGKSWWKCLSAADFPAEAYQSFSPAWHFAENENNLYSLSRLKEAPGGETFTPLYEGAFNSCFLSPFLHSSLDTFINRPLLLNHVSQASPDQELYFEYYGNELGYRQLL